MQPPDKLEIERQSTILAQAIQNTIEQIGATLTAQGGQPTMNAVAGALVSVEATMLAAIPSPARKALRKAMDKMQPQALAAAISKGDPGARVEVVQR